MKKYILLASLLIISAISKAQQTDTTNKSTSADSLMNQLTVDDKHVPVIATFKATRLVLSQTTETVKKNNLNFLVIHRFGDIGGVEGGSSTLYGFDNSSDIYIGFEYGLSNNLDIDFGRSKYEQLIDLGLKYAILHQTSDNQIPVAVTLIGRTGFKPYKDFNHVFSSYGDRFSYIAEAVVARKFSSNFSLQVSPIFLRINSPYPFIAGSERQFFSLAVAGRLKITKRVGIIIDYTHPFSSFRQNSTNPSFYDPLGIGIEIETGGHVFTINFSNAKAISEINYLTDTESKWSKGQFRLGFTISRMFDLNPKHKNNYK